MCLTVYIKYLLSCSTLVCNNYNNYINLPEIAIIMEYVAIIIITTLSVVNMHPQ